MGKTARDVPRTIRDRDIDESDMTLMPDPETACMTPHPVEYDMYHSV